MTIFRGLLFSVLGLFALAVTGVGSLWVATIGDYPVLPTVVDDLALPQTEVDGVRLHMRSFGDAEQPTLVVLHGGPGADHRSLLPLAALQDEYRVIFYDQRGAGLSQRVAAGDLTLDHYINELDGLLDLMVDAHDIHLIGHSWGGILASAYMGRHPERIAGAVLIEPGYLTASERADWSARSGQLMSSIGFFSRAMMAGFEALHVSGPDANAIDDYLIGEMAHAFAAAPDNPYHCPDMTYSAPSWRFGAAANKAAADISDTELDAIAAHLPAVDAPVLLMAGACDDWIGEPLQRQHLALFKNAELVIVPDAGHDVVHDNPDHTIDVVRAFLRSVGTAN